ncbi:uncharacterized protein B0H18DRAFT_966939 [Fomitopsis serialis]|uniref:uncharacterized protein n=1 Tax=Fomitopsis serialis TaxID=139415 RepID=UPI0020086CF4|nr:uncharacterized protein B0H18DRAFT_966939 [Neoantrodia serialis]KAH9938398.1 hypothetical protein B0H18DRAFT_966939 [Neoantrodia serialis]
MADDEDDYLSDKFLLETYAERRKEAQRLSAIKNEQSRKKSRRQLEQEAGKRGFAKAWLQNKALAMMMKMGYKPGESLGQNYDDPPPAESSAAAAKSATADDDVPADAFAVAEPAKGGIGHRVEPLPLNEWAGKTGIDHVGFRDRARQEYEDRRAQGRLAPAQRTCITLDEKDGRKVCHPVG